MDKSLIQERIKTDPLLSKNGDILSNNGYGLTVLSQNRLPIIMPDDAPVVRRRRVQWHIAALPDDPPDSSLRPDECQLRCTAMSQSAVDLWATLRDDHFKAPGVPLQDGFLEEVSIILLYAQVYHRLVNCRQPLSTSAACVKRQTLRKEFGRNSTCQRKQCNW
jgi:hypothetical protein